MSKEKQSKLQNITLSADKDLIELARKRAKEAKTTLNAEFRNWLKQFSNTTRDRKWFLNFMGQFDQVNSGRKFTREDFYKE